MGNQIAMLLNDFGSHREAIQYAERSNEIFTKREENRFIESIMMNNLIIANSKSKLGEYSEALKRSEALFNSVAKIAEWNDRLGIFITESVKISFELVFKELATTQREKNQIYFMLELLKHSFGPLQPTKSREVLERLKTLIVNNKSPTNLLRSIFTELYNRELVYEVENMVNVTFHEFLQRQDEQVKENVGRAMNNFKLVYECLGADFMLSVVIPVA